MRTGSGETMADGTDFGRTLRELRLRAGQTQQQLAQKSGLSVSAIQSYEIGRRQPDAASVERLKKPLGLDKGEAVRLRRSAGLRPQETGLTAAWLKARGAPNTVWDEVQGCDWISLVTNERKEIVAWNRLANRVGELDLATLSQFQRSVLRMTSAPKSASHLPRNNVGSPGSAITRRWPSGRSGEAAARPRLAAEARAVSVSSITISLLAAWDQGRPEAHRRGS